MTGDRSAPAMPVTGAGPQPLDRRVRVLWWTDVALATAGAAVAFGLLGWVLAARTSLSAATVVTVTVLVVGTGGALGAGWVPLAHRRWTWALAPDAVELSHGVVWRTVSVVPYARVQHIDLEQGPVERLLGLVTLRLRTASATSDATIPGIATGEADAIRALILARAGRDDAV